MSIALAAVILVVIGGLIAAAVRIWRRRAEGAEVDGGVDVIPYLLLALAVGTSGFTLATLARASLTADQLAGRPTGEIAGALAGLVVSAPIAFLLWRRQAGRRKIYPEAAGWPIYLTLVELVFLAAFFLSVWDLAAALSGEGGSADWTDLVIYGGIVAFHWWSEWRDRPGGDARDLPRLTGSGVTLIALSIGLIGSLTWLLSMAYDGIWGLDQIPEPAMPLALLIASAPIWAYRWLASWDDEAGSLRNFYLGLATTVSLTLVIGALLTLVSTVITFLLGEGAARQASDHFSDLPLTLAILLGGGTLWWHHVRRLGPGRTKARRGYEYAMAAIGLAGLVGSSVALVEAVFTPTLAGTDSAATLLTLGCIVIAAGWVWLYFWRRVQKASPRDEEIRALPRRFYLVGMAIVLGLTAAGSLIAALVIVFRALLGEVDAMAGDLRLPVTLTLLSGLATWHLIDQLRHDRAGMGPAARPFSLTVICSHPGNLGALLPREARVRVIYRDDDIAMIDDDMASAIVSAVDGRSSFVWVDQDGFRVAPARER